MIKQYETFVNEAKQVGAVFHFTNLNRLIQMLENKCIKGGTDFLDGHKTRFISTTRLYDFDWLDKSVRLTLDGNLISNKYKITPTHYFNQIYNDEHRMHGQTLKKNVNVAVNQCEERVLTSKLPLVPYVIDIQCVIEYEKSENIVELLEKSKYLTQELSIPFSLTNSYKPFYL